MSSEAMKWARLQSFGSLSLKALVNAIAARADKKGSTWVSQRTLADDLGASDRHIRELLAKAEMLGVITRTPRSAGRRGRLTDLMTLTLQRSFCLTASDVRAVRRACPGAVPTGSIVPLAGKSSNRNKSTLPTGTRVPGNIKGTTYPLSQGEKNLSEGTSKAETVTNHGKPRLVIAGGRAISVEDGR